MLFPELSNENEFKKKKSAKEKYLLEEESLKSWKNVHTIMTADI